MKKRKWNRLGMMCSLSACFLCLVVFAADGADAAEGAVGLALIEEAGTQWNIPADAAKVSVLAVGGGGGGAPGLGNAGGGGGVGKIQGSQ